MVQNNRRFFSNGSHEAVAEGLLVSEMSYHKNERWVNEKAEILQRVPVVQQELDTC